MFFIQKWNEARMAASSKAITIKGKYLLIFGKPETELFTGPFFFFFRLVWWQVQGTIFQQEDQSLDLIKQLNLVTQSSASSTEDNIEAKASPPACVDKWA